MRVRRGTQQTSFARATAQLGLGVRIESGGALCGEGSGEQHAASALKGVDAYLRAGGTLRLVPLESIFSRTFADCRSQPRNATAEELGSFAAAWSAGLARFGQASPAFFLYTTRCRT